MVNIWEILGQLDSEVVVSVVADEPLPAEINCLADDGDDDYERLERIAIQSVEAETEFLRVWPAAMESLRCVLGDEATECLLRAEFGGLNLLKKVEIENDHSGVESGVVENFGTAE